MDDVSKQIIISRSKRPKLWAVLTVVWNFSGALLVIESWEALLHPHAVGGILMIVAGTLLGKTGASAATWRGDVERRR